MDSESELVLTTLGTLQRLLRSSGGLLELTVCIRRPDFVLGDHPRLLVCAGQLVERFLSVTNFWRKGKLFRQTSVSLELFSSVANFWQ